MDPEESARADELRRRLYAPGVTAEDVAAFRAIQTLEEPPAPTESDDPDELGADDASDAPPPRRRSRVPVLVGAALLVAAVVGVLLTVPPVRSSRPTASPTPTADPQVVISTSANARRGFVTALQSGERAGILPYLSAHPSDLPPMLRTPQRAASDEYSGQGTSTITLDPSALAERGGRVTILFVPDRPTTFSWQAERVAQDNDRSGPLVAVDAHAGSARAGEPVSTTFAYDGRAPARLSLYLDETVKWGAAVVFTN